MSEIVSVSVSPPSSTTDASGDIVVNAPNTISGWENVSITCRCDGFPNEFQVSASALDPATRAATPGRPGDVCTVRIGDDRVVTGYMDERAEGFGPHDHALTFIGRGKTQDLVDCSAEWPSGQIIGGDALSIAQQLADAYNLEVALANGASAGPQVPQWALNYTETGAAIVQRLAQNAGLIAYEDADGRLLLANVGTDQASSGVVYGDGGNIEGGSLRYSMHERYSAVVCSWRSMALLDVKGGSDFFYTALDQNVRRHRQLDIVLAEVGGSETAQDFTIRRAKWEIARRAGRSTVVQVTVDSWRDGGGKLWAPNTLVPVSVPSPQFAGPLILASVTYRRDAKTGTHADLVLMPREAFTIEPISLLTGNFSDVKSAPPSP